MHSLNYKTLDRIISKQGQKPAPKNWRINPIMRVKLKKQPTNTTLPTHHEIENKRNKFRPAMTGCRTVKLALNFSALSKGEKIEHSSEVREESKTKDLLHYNFLE